MQARLQSLFLKASVTAFKMCTSTSTGSELSRREKTCVRNAAGAFAEAKKLLMQASANH